MYLCYVDESGYNGNRYNDRQPVQTMVGIFPNLYNFHKSDSEFKDVFEIIQNRISVSELKAEEIYRGRGSWRSIEPRVRDAVIEYYLRWISSRRHKFIVTAIDNKKFFDIREQEPENKYIEILKCPWVLSAFHISLIIQKCNRNLAKNKGKTMLVFDEESEFENYLAELIFTPPEFIDEFVQFNERTEKTRLNQIIDSAFFVKSHHSSMAQVVDIVSYFFRLYLELNYYSFQESYDGEKEKVNSWIDQINNKFMPFSKIYPTGRKRFIQFLNKVKANGI